VWGLGKSPGLGKWWNSGITWKMLQSNSRGNNRYPGLERWSKSQGSFPRDLKAENWNTAGGNKNKNYDEGTGEGVSFAEETVRGHPFPAPRNPSHPRFGRFVPNWIRTRGGAGTKKHSLQNSRPNTTIYRTFFWAGRHGNFGWGSTVLFRVFPFSGDRSVGGGPSPGPFQAGA